MVEELRKKEWKGPVDVEWLKVGEKTLADEFSGKQAQGGFGKIFIGKLKFKGKKPFPVAVKRFWEQMYPQSSRDYSRVINNLREAGVKMPKMAILRQGKERVLVSELFAKKRGTKIIQLAELDPVLHQLSEKSRRNFTDFIASVINAGYTPPWDSLGMLQTRQGIQPLIYDVDLFLNPPGHYVDFTANLLKKMFPDNAHRSMILDKMREKILKPSSVAIFEEVRKVAGAPPTKFRMLKQRRAWEFGQEKE